jgi:hypothetical protein
MERSKMDMNEWAESLTDEQRAALAGMNDDEMAGYLADQGVELPDEVLEGVAGGLPLGKLVGSWLKEKLHNLLH